jgi:exosortase
VATADKNTADKGNDWERFIPEPPVLAAWGLLFLAAFYVYWSTFMAIGQVWAHQEDYGHCFFVVPFAIYLLWHRRDMVDPIPTQGTLWALPFFAVWALMRIYCVFAHYQRDFDSIYPLLIGITLLLGGWKAFRWAWPAILFLVFADPLPGQIEVALRQPLQTIATRSSLYLIQTLGIPAMPWGEAGHSHVIQLMSGPLNVEEACAGLRMLMLFFAVCVGAAMVIRVSWWEKAILVASAIPIAVFSNVMRITLTGVVQHLISVEAGKWFHDYVGYFMMPLAMLLVWGEMTLISKLMIEPETMPLSLGQPVGMPSGLAGMGRVAPSSKQS